MNAMLVVSCGLCPSANYGICGLILRYLLPRPVVFVFVWLWTAVDPDGLDGSIFGLCLVLGVCSRDAKAAEARSLVGYEVAETVQHITVPSWSNYSSFVDSTAAYLHFDAVLTCNNLRFFDVFEALAVEWR
ncbi:hypothetical protein Nepgr_030903 [Nepenthes gracilis]|uniref:Uncharacterized protein n=1 Tax=Nepenthes gracilis TaxID=150966 RepID=A0AAD3TFF7_NEPGR|nr:hypothetical protein Nepgr_030903 [Nepenthes gracilis]